MPLCKDEQRRLTQLAAEAVRLVDCRSDLALELLGFRGKTSSISEDCFLLTSLYDQLFEGMEMLFKCAFVERGIFKIWRNSGVVEAFMLEPWVCSNRSGFLQLFTKVNLLLHC